MGSWRIGQAGIQVSRHASSVASPSYGPLLRVLYEGKDNEMALVGPKVLPKAVIFTDPPPLTVSEVIVHLVQAADSCLHWAGALAIMT